MRLMVGHFVRGAMVGLVLVCVLIATPARGQGRDIGGPGRIYNEELRLQLDSQMPDAREKGFDAGGWLNLAFFAYEDDPAQRERHLMRYALRGWASLNIQGVHRAYFRGLLQLDDWGNHDNPMHRGDDFDSRVERAWYQFDLGQLMALKSGQRPPIGFKVRAGRDFNTIGTALVLSMPLDGARFTISTRKLDTEILLGKTVGWVDNIDPSDRVAEQQDRLIFATQVTSKHFAQHRPFAYFMLNNDYTNAEPKQPAVQAYEYDSNYVGIGSTGTVLLPKLLYSTELVGEWGSTYSNGANAASDKDNICAMAFDAQLSYRFDCPTRPKVEGEYLYASGDKDRAMSSVATVGGNQIGSKDRAFNAFGFRDTGIAFAPRISNLHMLMAGASFYPLESLRCFREMEVGAKIFAYQKAAKTGAMDDTTATNAARWLGWEWDLYCNWRITSDLSWTFRYGMFFPGDAFSGTGDKSNRHFLYTGMVFSF